MLLELKINISSNMLVGSKNAQLVMPPMLLEMLVLNVENHVNYVLMVPQIPVPDVLMDILLKITYVLSLMLPMHVMLPVKLAKLQLPIVSPVLMVTK